MQDTQPVSSQRQRVCLKIIDQHVQDALISFKHSEVYRHVSSEWLLILDKLLDALWVTFELVSYKFNDGFWAEIARGLQYVHRVFEPDLHYLSRSQP